MSVYTVSKINRVIKDIVDNEPLLEDIVVTGELSSFSVTRGIAYFTLKEEDNLLSCVQFGCKQEFQIGDMVQCRGNVKYYPKGGKLTFNSLNIQLSGQGELYQQFLKLKEKLADEGLFDDFNKIPIPKFIKSVGVVTSATGAVLQDIRNVALRRNPNLDIYVYDAQVQGKFAVNDIIQGITYFDNLSDVDVIVVARGGGSIEDLMPFNDEELARIAFICNKPLISAVGHETDFSILDFVADLRAPTPSAAAELITIDNNELKTHIYELLQTMNKVIDNKVLEIEMLTKMLISETESAMKEFINGEILFVNDIVNKLEFLTEKKLDATKYSVDIAINSLDKLNPIRLLKSGYSYVTKDGTSVEKTTVEVGDKVQIQTSSNQYFAEIIDKIVKTKETK